MVTNTEVCDQSERNVLKEKKTLISQANRLQRFSFALSNSFDFWKTTVFSDESKLNIFGSDGRRMMWRKPNEALKIKNIKPTVKHGGGSVMVLGSMTA